MVGVLTVPFFGRIFEVYKQKSHGKWVTVYKTRDICIRHSRVPLPEIYSSLPEAFRVAYADETEVPGVEVVPALGGVEVGWFSRESTVVLPFQIRSLETIPTTRCNGWGPDSSLKRLWIFVEMQVYTM